MSFPIFFINETTLGIISDQGSSERLHLLIIDVGIRNVLLVTIVHISRVLSLLARKGKGIKFFTLYVDFSNLSNHSTYREYFTHR